MNRAKGNMAEEQAVTFLQQNGFSIIERNFHSRFGEIDIIAEKGGVLHFVEVKSASSYEIAVANITPKKLSRIIKTAEVYMKKNAYLLDYTFDAVVVTPYGKELVCDITL